MNLKMLLHNRRDWPDDATIYVAEPWTPNSPAILSNEDPDTTNPIVHTEKTYAYFLEGNIARDFLDALRVPDNSNEAACERLIQYAVNDA